MVELLAPAGQIESGYAAFSYGADAVYLGLTRFSARAEAENFTPEALVGFVRYAHTLKKKVLIAVNTVFFDDEKADLIETLQDVRSAGADGVIVQDLGTARLIKNYFPELRLHASTQLAVHNRDGVEALRDMGFKRVVLARELTLDEIKDICRVPGIEKEVFIHGALCYCYSGLCLFSSIYAGRSANRGKCVYPCRESFHIDGRNKHVFSMKDLAQNENVLLLEQAGVTALKIEGRKKSPLYVAAVTDYYRSILDGEKNKTVLQEKRDKISCIFSRPTTELFLKNRRNFNVIDTDIVGHRGLMLGIIKNCNKRGDNRFVSFKTAAAVGRYDGIQIDLPKEERPFGFSAETLRVNGKNVFEVKAGQTVEIALPENAPFIPVGATVYLSSSNAVKSAFPYTKPRETEPFIGNIEVTVNVDGRFVAAHSAGQTVSVAGQFSAAKSVETAENAVRKAFEKTGGTGLVLKSLEIENPDKLFVPLSVLNELRRGLYERVGIELSQTAAEQKAKEKEDILSRESVSATSSDLKPSYSVKTDDEVFFKTLIESEDLPLDEIVFLLSPKTDLSLFEPKKADKIRFALPVVARSWEMQALKEKIKTLTSKGFRKFETANVWGLNALKNKSVDFSCDWPVYVANLSAARGVLETGASSFVVSPETPEPETLFKAFPEQATGVIYQDPPLFVSESCPYAALESKCQNCGGNRIEELKSRYGTFISVMKNCRHFLLGEHPRLKKQEMLKAGARRLRLEFLYRNEKPEQRTDILRRLIKM
ncbi:MAG: U32 family peptidase [Alphaproteobacteria bacterium]|nr:U32 family peptidase [Alphaproteobacteria bacterium]